MTKRITLELTEDQLDDMIGLIDAILPSQQWWVNEYPSKRAYADANPDKPDLRRHTDNKWSPVRFEKTKQSVAFRKRLLTTLAKAKTQNNS